MQHIFKRYELKYLITREQQKQLLTAMNEEMKPDAFGKSTLCNLYFDTKDDRLIRRSLEKPEYKEKLRLRSYGVASDDSSVFVELKKKYDGVVYKRRIHRTLKEATDYFEREIPFSNPCQITREIDYFCEFYQSLRPAMFLSYEREAYFDRNNHDFRMTFDENILWREEELSLKQGIYGNSLLESGQVLLEVKTAGSIPLWLAHALSENKIYQSSFSKYGKAFQQEGLINEMGGSKIA